MLARLPHPNPGCSFVLVSPTYKYSFFLINTNKYKEEPAQTCPKAIGRAGGFAGQVLCTVSGFPSGFRALPHTCRQSRVSCYTISAAEDLCACQGKGGAVNDSRYSQSLALQAPGRTCTDFWLEAAEYPSAQVGWGKSFPLVHDTSLGPSLGSAKASSRAHWGQSQHCTAPTLRWRQGKTGREMLLEMLGREGWGAPEREKRYLC